MVEFKKKKQGKFTGSSETPKSEGYRQVTVKSGEGGLMEKKTGKGTTYGSEQSGFIQAAPGENVRTRRTGDGYIVQIGDAPAITVSSNGMNTTHFGNNLPPESLLDNTDMRTEEEQAEWVKNKVLENATQKQSAVDKANQPIQQEPQKKSFLQNVGEGLNLVDTAGGLISKEQQEIPNTLLDYFPDLGLGFPVGNASKGVQAESRIAKAAKGNPVEQGLVEEEIVKASEEILRMGKGKTPAERAIFREIKIKEISNILNISEQSTARLVNSYNKWSKPQVMQFLSSSPGKMTAAKIGLGAGGLVASGDLITTWYALDNVGDGFQFTIASATKGMESGSLTLDQAHKLFKEQEEIYDIAIIKVDKSTRWNSAYWATGDMIKRGMRAKKAKYDIDRLTFYTKFQ